MNNSQESAKMVRFQVYLCPDDADLVKWLAAHRAPESDSDILKYCILGSTSLTELARERFYRQNARKNCPIAE